MTTRPSEISAAQALQEKLVLENIIANAIRCYREETGLCVEQLIITPYGRVTAVVRLP